ncbi:MAG TPA: nuclear transport factor 2 family protein [Dehalococcoidales bacterium]|nr:nuclear transport factor 2 family protein [Dehalococcoidales bacterium]
MTTKELEEKVAKLEERVRTLEATEAIQKFHLNYIYLYNNHRHEEMVACFADDAVLDTGVFKTARGREEIARIFRDDIPRVNNWATAHAVIQPMITVDGDRAKGLWIMYLIFYDVPTPKGPSVRMVQALHDCEYVKVDGEWKFSSVKFIRPWPARLECMPKPA